MKTKFILLTALCVFTFLACSKDNDEEAQLVPPPPAELSQTAFADEGSTGKGFTFTARSEWTASVVESNSGVRSEEVSWLKLLLGGVEKYSGAAGTFTFVVEVSPNYTGTTRSATVTIQCGDEKTTVLVSQKGLTESGQVPQKLVRKITINTRYNGDTDQETLVFSYDGNRRIKDVLASGERTVSIMVNYSDKEIVFYTNGEEAGKVTLNSDNLAERYDYSWSYIYEEGDIEAEEGKVELTYRNGYLAQKINHERSTWNGSTIAGIIKNSLTWENGNLVQVTNGGEDESGEEWAYASVLLQYNTVVNKANLDLNWFVYKHEPVFLLEDFNGYLISQGYFGKRNTNLVVEERDGEGNGYGPPYFYKWTFDSDGYPNSVTVTGENENSGKNNYTETYLFEY